MKDLYNIQFYDYTHNIIALYKLTFEAIDKGVLTFSEKISTFNNGKSKNTTKQVYVDKVDDIEKNIESFKKINEINSDRIKIVKEFSEKTLKNAILKNLSWFNESNQIFDEQFLQCDHYITHNEKDREIKICVKGKNAKIFEKIKLINSDKSDASIENVYIYDLGELYNTIKDLFYCQHISSSLKQIIDENIKNQINIINNLHFID